MKFLLLVAVSAIAYSSFTFAHNSGKVKIVKADLLALDGGYFSINTHKIEVRDVNQTYNSLDVDFTVTKTLPFDTHLVCQVFQSNLDCANYQMINEYRIPVCSNAENEYEAHLPEIIVQMRNAGQCVPKGRYNIDDCEYFKFYNLLSEEELKYHRYLMIVSLTSGANYLMTLQLEFAPNSCS